MLSPKDTKNNNNNTRSSALSDPSNMSMGTVDPDRDRDLINHDGDDEYNDNNNESSSNVRERLLKIHERHPELDEDNEKKLDPEILKREAYIARLYKNNCFFTPGWVLTIFTLVNTLTYYDRGSISSSATYIATDPSIVSGNSTLSQAQTGALYSIFMAGYFVFSPICIGLGSYFTSKSIVIAGLICWCLAVVLAGVSNSYGLLMVARALTGISEGCSGFLVTIIDNVCPRESRTKWIGIFFSTIPFGTALGIAINGQICGIDFGFISGWRMGFFIELIPMIILVIMIFFLPKELNTRNEDRGEEEIAAAKLDEERIEMLHREQKERFAAREEAKNRGLNNNDANNGSMGSENSNNNNLDNNNDDEDQQSLLIASPLEKAPEEEEAEKSGTHVPLWKAIKLLACNANFLLLSFGYGAYTFVLGAISFFAIAMMTEGPMDVSEGLASILLGATTAILGLIGAIVGGLLVDKWGGSKGWRGVYKCSLLLATCMIIAVPCGFILLSIDNFTIFVVLFVFSVWWLFLVTAPLNTALLTVVPPNLRPYSVALSVCILHLFGDFPSTPLTGAIADAYDEGCSNFDDNEFRCMTHNTTNGACKFMPKPSPREKSRCVNDQELTTALRFAWCVMILAVPLWGAVAYRVKKHRSVFGYQGEHHVDDDAEQTKKEEDEKNASRAEAATFAE